MRRDTTISHECNNDGIYLEVVGRVEQEEGLSGGVEFVDSDHLPPVHPRLHVLAADEEVGSLSGLRRLHPREHRLRQSERAGLLAGERRVGVRERVDEGVVAGKEAVPHPLRYLQPPLHPETEVAAGVVEGVAEVAEPVAGPEAASTEKAARERVPGVPAVEALPVAIGETPDVQIVIHLEEGPVGRSGRDAGSGQEGVEAAFGDGDAGVSEPEPRVDGEEDQLLPRRPLLLLPHLRSLRGRLALLPRLRSLRGRLALLPRLHSLRGRLALLLLPRFLRGRRLLPPPPLPLLLLLRPPSPPLFLLLLLRHLAALVTLPNPKFRDVNLENDVLLHGAHENGERQRREGRADCVRPYSPSPPPESSSRFG